MKEFRNRYPSQLSGGQQQRVGLARALAVDPKIMLMDEPFGAVDSITREKLQAELVRLHKETGKTFLFVTHDMEEAFKLGDRVIIMDEGTILFDGLRTMNNAKILWGSLLSALLAVGFDRLLTLIEKKMAS